MRPRLNILVASCRLENKRNLLRTMEELPVNTYSCSSIEEAWEVLTSNSVDLILCDERLPDGAYPEFFFAARAEHMMVRFVVMLASNEWEDYLKAMKLGVTDALRLSYQPTDVELILIRAGGRTWQQEDLRTTASS